MNYKKSITTAEEAKSFLKEFYKEYPVVHPEYDMANIVNPEDGTRTFTDEQVEAIHSRIDEVYDILALYPCLYIIDELQ